MPPENLHSTDHVQKHLDNAKTSPGTFRLYRAVETVNGNARVTLCKLNPVNNEAIMVGVFTMTQADWETVKQVNAGLKLAALT